MKYSSQNRLLSKFKTKISNMEWFIQENQLLEEMISYCNIGEDTLTLQTAL
jgi:hypothetical protein